MSMDAASKRKKDVQKMLDDFEQSLYVPNMVTEQLEYGLATGENVFIRGMSGFGKTASSQSFCDHYKDLNCVWFDCAFLGLRSEEPGKTHTKDDLTMVGQLFSDGEIEMMQKPKTVVICDNYEYADENVRQHLNLLCDRFAISENGEVEFVPLGNIVFVAVIENT